MVTPNGYSKIEYTAHDEKRKLCEGPPSRDEERSPFERDRARIIHSAAFRRLQGKTQVFAPGEGDFYRTRLTHSLEVAQIAKGLALRLGADPDLVEAAALLHDIGHPPFGHAGEDELKRLMVKYGGFEANAQNLRLITEVEKKSTKYRGLNLTRAVIDAQLKYKTPPNQNPRKFIYAKDLKLADWASKAARTAACEHRYEAKSFECQIMDWADEVAYAIHDLEDGIRSRYIDAFTFADQSQRLSDALADVQNKFDDDIDVEKEYKRLVDRLQGCNPCLKTSRSADELTRSSEYRKEMTTALINRYVTCARRCTLPGGRKNPISSRYLYVLWIPLEYRIEVALINSVIRRFVITAPQVYTLENKGKQIIRALFFKFMRDINLLPDDWRYGVSANDARPKKARVICDYISGMTDDYAQKTYAKMFSPQYGSIYEVV